MDRAPEKLTRSRDALEARILLAAVEVFAEAGYAGSALASIAERAGISKQNLLYYFSTKQILYKKVLDQVLDQWLERMNILADPTQDPAQLLRSYIRAKLRFSREQPQASRVYAMEVISGAPVYAETMRNKILPLLQKDIAVFEAWIAAGKIAAVNTTHLLFAIWAMTQSYADFAAQMSLVLGHSPLNENDFQDAENMIVEMVLGRVC
ncbi:TetR family transcriptional regulator C-terminal domain-containing protein [Undibacterium sp. TJN19]|uniref:TetR family transcriptional regulator C-terminal domain-containing protein n=1 Tax=Undibacterium sp. TJN19 TaxID=3413055 RepID=UPI003BF32559